MDIVCFRNLPWAHGQQRAVVQGVNGVQTLFMCVIRGVQDVPLALNPGLWKISCSKQKWKNSPEELEKEYVAWAAGFFFFPMCGYIEVEGDEMQFKN